MVSLFATNTPNPASTPHLQQSQCKGSSIHVLQKLLCGGTFAIAWLHYHGVQAPAGFVMASISLLNIGSVTRNTGWVTLQALCQSILQERNLTRSYHFRPIYLKIQWAFKNSPAHMSFPVMVVNCFVFWFCGLLREPWFSAYDDISIGKKKLTALTLPLEKNEKASWGLQMYKTCNETKNNHPSKQKVNAFSTCVLHEGRISCPAEMEFTRLPKGLSTVCLSAPKIMKLWKYFLLVTGGVLQGGGPLWFPCPVSPANWTCIPGRWNHQAWTPRWQHLYQTGLVHFVILL